MELILGYGGGKHFSYINKQKRAVSLMISALRENFPMMKPAVKWACDYIYQRHLKSTKQGKLYGLHTNMNHSIEVSLCNEKIARIEVSACENVVKVFRTRVNIVKVSLVEKN